MSFFENMSRDEQIRKINTELPYDVQQIIYNFNIRKTFSTHVMPSITQKKRDTTEILRKLHIDPDDADYLIDIDFRHLNILLHLPRYTTTEKTAKIAQYFVYLSKCVIGFIEYYYSLSFDKKQKVRAFVLDNELIYKPLQIANIRERFYDYIRSENLYDIIDPYDCHSGMTASWCITNMLPFLFGTYEQKL